MTRAGTSLVELYAALTGLGPLDLVAGAALPRLPAFERLLSRSDPVTAPADWRRWALAVAGLAAPPGDLPVGATLAAAAKLEAAAGTWLVLAPVHLTAGLSSVQLHSAGVLSLAPDAAGRLAARLNAELGAPQQRVYACGEHLLLQVDAALDLRCADPEALAGRDLGGALPEGADGGRLRRLMTELQMWLHDDPPLALEGLPINGLWPWGGGRGALAGTPRWPVLVSRDPFLCAVHAQAPGTAPRVAAQLVNWRFAALHAAAEPLARAEQEWFAPLATALARGALAAATVHYAGRAWRVTRRQRWRAWIRPRPWWEQGA